MKAAVFKETGKPLVIEEVPKPKPEEGELLVRVRTCGICGSDIHATEAGQLEPNTVMGHEFAGEVVEIGVGAEGDWLIGDRVIGLAEEISCGNCVKCKAGDDSECENKKLFSFTPEINGAYSEFIRIGAASVIKVPDAISFEEAALVEPLAVGLEAIRRANLKVRENILIVGAGPIGLAIVHWGRFFGCGNVVVSEKISHRLSLAKTMGATAVIDANREEDVIAAYKRITGTTPDVIFEAVGIPGMIQQCIEMAQPGTRIVVTGVCHGQDTFQPRGAVWKSLDLLFASQYSKEDFQFTLDMMGQGRINPKPLISHCVSLDDLPETFEALRHPSDQCKVIVLCT